MKQTKNILREKKAIMTNKKSILLYNMGIIFDDFDRGFKALKLKISGNGNQIIFCKKLLYHLNLIDKLKKSYCLYFLVACIFFNQTKFYLTKRD